MTARESSVKKNFFAPKFFLNTLSKSWTHFLLYFIICFFALPVPILIGTGSSYYPADSHATFAEKVADALDMLNALNVVGMLVAAAIAVFAGCAATRYLNTKTSTNFYHSLPITREAIYLTKTLVGIIDFLAALVLTLSASAFVLLLRVGSSAEIGAALLGILGNAVLMFLTVFFVCVFVGMFCGTTGVQFVMTGVTLFIVPVVFACVLFFVGEFTRYVDTQYYWDKTMMYTSPVIRLLFSGSESLSALEVILLILLVVLLAVISLLIYKKRPNENSENPIVFGKAATFLKYLIMIPATLALGIWFEEIGGGLWLAFGLIMGALLSFMLVNAVFQKNARAMFKGFRGLVIFGVVFTLCFLALAFDVLKLGEYIPGENLISNVEVTIDNDSYGSYKDKALIKALETDLKRFMKSDKETEPEEVDYYWDAETEGYISKYRPKDYLVCKDFVSVNVVYHTKFGAPVAKTFFQIPKSIFTDSLKALANSAEFKDNYIKFIDYPSSDNFNTGSLGYDEIHLQSIKNFSDYYYERYGVDAYELFKAYKKDLGDISYESFQNTQVGYILKRVREGYRYNTTRMYLPIFINSENTLKLLLGKDVTDIYLDSIYSVNVFPVSDDGEYKKESVVSFTDPEKIRAILFSVADASDDFYNKNVFCEYDYRYYVDIRYYKDASDVDKDEEKYSFYEDWPGPVTYFIKGKVPEFVEKALG